ncbi:DUF724 domain-containing protein 8-like [Rutidosis leptorrhynchoides]|uniref:DUF724 domain-containing protein 8-like n=1 Tax=Rutidosis leptorrhynchoides TaxID=125765 RepID=UPI003A993A00
MEPSSNSSRLRGFRFLKKGAKIEVLPKDEGFHGSYFTATIIEMPQYTPWSSNEMHANSFVIQYDTLLTEDETRPLRELADFSGIRPLPPTTGNNRHLAFEVNDVVDAFYQDGWWVGSIEKILDHISEDGNKYRVRFEYSTERIVFTFSELRPHYDWVDGKWVKPQKKVSSVHKSSGKSKVENVATGTVEKQSDESRQCHTSSSKDLPEKVSLDMAATNKRQLQHEKLVPTPCSKKSKIVCSPIEITVATDKSRPQTVPLEGPHKKTVEIDGMSVMAMNQSIPFEKSSPVWKFVESLDVFKKYPQNPHFRPLVKEKEGMREGHAIGLMTNFSDAAEKISKLRYDDPETMFRTHLEVFPDLEKHGFIIAPLEKRLRELISTKANISQLQILEAETNAKVKDVTDEKTRTDEEIDGHAKNIGKHAKNMVEIAKRMDELAKMFKAEEEEKMKEESMKAKKESIKLEKVLEIAGLMSTLDTVSGDLGAARQKFQKLTGGYIENE